MSSFQFAEFSVSAAFLNQFVAKSLLVRRKSTSDSATNLIGRAFAPIYTADCFDWLFEIWKLRENGNQPKRSCLLAKFRTVRLEHRLVIILQMGQINILPPKEDVEVLPWPVKFRRLA